MHIAWHRPTISFSFVFIHVSVILFSAYEGGRMTATKRINVKLKKIKKQTKRSKFIEFSFIHTTTSDLPLSREFNRKQCD